MGKQNAVTVTPSDKEVAMQKTVNLSTMVIGVILFLASLAAWIYCAERGINTDILWAVVVPILTALFIGHQLGTTAENAQKAADQTNGSLEPRVKAAVASALADRDKARTRQIQGDVGVYVEPESEPDGNLA